MLRAMNVANRAERSSRCASSERKYQADQVAHIPANFRSPSSWRKQILCLVSCRGIGHQDVAPLCPPFRETKACGLARWLLNVSPASTSYTLQDGCSQSLLAGIAESLLVNRLNSLADCKRCLHRAPIHVHKPIPAHSDFKSNFSTQTF